MPTGTFSVTNYMANEKPQKGGTAYDGREETMLSQNGLQMLQSMQYP